MSPEAAKARLNQLLHPIWSFQQIEDWYGITLFATPQTFLTHFQKWASTHREDPSAAIEQGNLNRFDLELFMQDRGLVGVRAAAILLGMEVDSFRATLKAAEGHELITEQEASGAFPAADIFQASFIGDFYKRFPKLTNFTFSSFPSFCLRLHAAITDGLSVLVTPAFCPTSIKIKEPTPDIGHDWDAITNEPIGLPFQIWLDTRKPIQLKPDICSWLTYSRFEDILKGYADVSMDAEYQKHRDELKN